MEKMIKILGAGLAGLSAAINLKKAGEEVLVMERLPSVGMQIHANYQALRTDGYDSVKEWLASMNLEPRDYKVQYLSKMFLETPNTGVRTVSSRPVAFMLRGGKNSLEWGLYNEAKDLDVEFEFNTKQTTGDIIAVGHRWCDAAAYGEVYELPDFPDDHFFYMHDDRYSPRCWYAYMVPMGDKLVEIVNCVSQPHVPKLREYYARLLKENKFIRKHTEGKKPISAFGGYGGVTYPKTAKEGDKLLVGEAAGFQDVCRGFGIAYALQSGMLAAKSITEKKDYDALWKQRLGPELRKDFARRFVAALAGDRAVEWYFRKIKDQGSIDYSQTEPSDTVYNTVGEAAFRAELLKKKMLGHW
jgi:flavin-dependent dehydrogenase